MRPAAAVLALALIAATTGSRASAADEGKDTPIPAGIPVSLDGSVVPGEWEDAATLALVPSGPTVRVKQSRGTLLVALELDGPWPARAQWLFASRPGKEDGKVGDPGTVRIDYEPHEHDRPHALVTRAGEGGTWSREDGRVVVRASRLSSAASIEAAIPLALLGVAGRDPPPLRWLVGWFHPSRKTPSTFPAGLELSADLSGLPPDFRTTAKWARTVEWPKADGPGAFPKTEWDAWVEADLELLRRGAAAHSWAHSLRGDDAEPAREELVKKDAPIEREVLGNLRWVSEREPLTPKDLGAFAIGLWRLNRYDAALATLDATSLGGAAWRSAGTAYLRTTIARDAERFEEEATAWEAVAAAAPHPEPYRRAAARAREKQAALEAERAARLADEQADLPLVLLRTTKGEVVLRLLEDDVPQAVHQFVHLVETEKTKDGRPFYDGTLFHRVVPNRFAQGGDPTSRESCEGAGSGGTDWHVEGETNARHGFFRGAVGFAHRGDRKNRSQFFVVTGHPETDMTEQGFTCFATVVSGLDVVERLEACDALLSARILRKRDHPYAPKKR